jgi:hypothetical protein
MIIGAVALCVYSVIVCRLMKRHRQPSLRSSLVAMLAWLGVALGLNWLLLMG